MAVAEIFLAAFIEVLFGKLASWELLKLARLGGIHDKLKKWNKHLEIIHALLSDAEEKQITQRSVLLWLEDLQDLAYDIDDILDELATEVLRRKLMLQEEHGSSSSSRIPKVWMLIPTCCVRFTPGSVIFDLRVSSKVNEITSRLDDLAIRKTDLMLIQNVKGRSEKTEDDGSRTTTSLVVESRVWGREEDKAAIVRLLLEDSTRSNHRTDEVRVIPIIGMGGLGKTTLAQLVYNDVLVKDQFDLKAWLCVAEDFDLLRMTSRIYSSITEDGREFKDLNNVQISLKQKLLNKKFLIVLDDVWNENYRQWDLFRAPFLVGAPGSTIIVTTRIGSIARFMGSIKAHHLQPLTEVDSVCLIAQHALGEPNFDMHPDLKDVGEKIAKKCKGLPLVAKTIGGLLSTKVSLNQWKNVLASKAWDLPGGSSDIIPALRLSYHHLPPHLKHLFAYCSIFPKDYQFDVHELILLWMAEGFLKQSGKKHMEDLGFEYFHELLSRSFFQRSSENESSYVMHDLMNDLAQFVAGGLCTRLDDYMDKEEGYKVFEKSRHSSFLRHEYDAFKKFKAFEGVQRMRTLLPLPIFEVNSWHGFYFNIAVIDLLPKLRCLRVLSFSGYKNIIRVPNSISDMKHLRYLNFSHTEITQLPESICDLHNLQTLLLRGCSNLMQLPKCIRNLSNLRHLDIADTSALEKMPSGLGMLTSLRTLSKIVIDNGNGLKLSEIKGLVNLQGRLCIDGMQNVMNVQDAAAAGLLDKQGITELAFRWNNSANDSHGGIDNEVLRFLKPQEGLLSLEIESYRGTKFPSWVGDPSFSSIVKLRLSNSRKCTTLQSLGCLISLRELFIKGMDGVNVISDEFFGSGLPGVHGFPSLETLSFNDMAVWKEWSANFASGDKNVQGVFPRLAKLQISRCPKLINVSLPQIPSLEELELTSCSEVVLRSIVSLGSIKTLMILDISGLTQLDGVIQFSGALDDLKIRHCRGLKYLWQEDAANQKLTVLRSLSVEYCGRLISLGEKEQGLPYNLENLELRDCANLEKMPSYCENLRTLRIYSCNKLQYLPHSPELENLMTGSSNQHREDFPNLQVLEIKWCSDMACLPIGKKLPTSLKSLSIVECANLKEPEDGEKEDLEPSLESIRINNWANLELSPRRWLFCFVHLTRMEIENCPCIVSFPERFFHTNLRILKILDCDNLKYLCNDDHMMQSLESLQELRLSRCKNLESFSDGFWPPNLKYLEIGGLKQSITEWGLNRLPTSLLTLIFMGEIPELVSFSEVGTQLHTTSLKFLGLGDLENLESLSSGLQNLTSLEQLDIGNCPKLRSLPEMLLPNLSGLWISRCPHLEQRCRKEKRDYWPFISHIPCVKIDCKLLSGL